MRSVDDCVDFGSENYRVFVDWINKLPRFYDVSGPALELLARHSILLDCRVDHELRSGLPIALDCITPEGF